MLEPTTSYAPLSRRRFLRLASTGALLATGVPHAAWPKTGDTHAHRTVADSTSAGLFEIGERLWATVSRPLDGGRDTLCNGGLVAGTERVLAFDAYASAAGAGWLIAQARTLTGRAPTDLVLSHHHGDHVGGLSAFAALDPQPRLWLTQAIDERVRPGQIGPKRELLDAATHLAPGAPTEIDLGGRKITLTAFSGHTASDIVARVGDDATFYGDLVWHRLFPNFVDAEPHAWSTTIATLFADPAAVNVPGHGPLPTVSDLARYRALLDEIEHTARAAYAAGTPAADAARGYTLPESLGSWTLFNPRYFEIAFGAWHRELDRA